MIDAIEVRLMIQIFFEVVTALDWLISDELFSAHKLSYEKI